MRPWQHACSPVTSIGTDLFTVRADLFTTSTSSDTKQNSVCRWLEAPILSPCMLLLVFFPHNLFSVGPERGCTRVRGTWSYITPQHVALNMVDASQLCWRSCIRSEQRGTFPSVTVHVKHRAAYESENSKSRFFAFGIKSFFKCQLRLSCF